MKMQCEIGEDNCIKVLLDNVDGVNPHVVNTKRNWIQNIVHCQHVGYGGYGAWFPAIPSFQSDDRDSRILWILSGMIVCVKELWFLTDKVNMHVSKWHGWLLAYLTKVCFPEIIFRGGSSNPMRKDNVRTIPRILDKVGIETGMGMFDYRQLGGMFDDHEHVCVMYNSVFSNTRIVQRYIDYYDQVVIIFHDSREYNSELPEKFVSHGHTYELRFIACTVDMPGDFKWNGEIYCRHGKEHHKSWWVLNRHKGLFLHTVNGGFNDMEFGNVDVNVYVVDTTPNMEKLRLEFMRYIGGQTQVQCSEHKMPLIVGKTSMEKCYMHLNDSLECCNRKLYYKCPTFGCKTGLCKRCYQHPVGDDMVYIDPPSVDVEDENSDSRSLSRDISSSTDEVHDDVVMDNDSCENVDEWNDFNDLLAPMEHDDINDYVLLGNDDDILPTEIVPEDIPSTLAGDIPFVVEEDTPKGMKVSGHVIMNQCGSLLNRMENDITGFRYQKHFLQRIASISHDTTVPLLYPEAMLFPSIFWSMVPECGSLFGAIPSGLLVKSGRHRFASMKNHVRCRLGHAGSSTSTNPSYIAYMYDILVNLSLNREDSRICLNRGVTASSSETGMTVRGGCDGLLSDSIDNKQTVRNLCASQVYHKMDFFLTFTCNQREHFGISHIKKWIDGHIWESYFPEFSSFTDYEKEEVRKGMKQSASGLLLRNWMEVRKVFINYLFKSETSPYTPSDAIFARDEYQGDVGNLPHMHMLIAMKDSEMSVEQKENMHDLVRASVCDIVSFEEVDTLVEEGILNDFSDIYELQDLAEEILAHHCNARCVRRVGDGDGPENFKCRKPNNLIISPDNTKHCHIPLGNNFSAECIDKLIDIGMADPITYSNNGVPSEFRSSHPFFHPKRHIPPTNPHFDQNISPVEGKTFHKIALTCVVKILVNAMNCPSNSHFLFLK